MTTADSQRVKRELILRSLFPTMPISAQVRFVELLEDVEFGPGELAFAAGDAPDRFMFLTEGRVALEMEGLKSIEFSGYAVVGVVDAVLERPRQRACRALEPSKALMMRTADWFDLLEDNGEIARATIRNFATQLHPRWREWAQRLPRPGDAPRLALPSKLENYDKILVLRRAAFLKRAGMQAIASLAAVADTLPLRAGEPLFDLGTGGERIFVVAAGFIELSHPSGLRLRHGAGELIGGPAAFCNALTEYAAVARTDSIVLGISQQEFYDQAEEHGRLLRGTLAFLASELEALQAVASD